MIVHRLNYSLRMLIRTRLEGLIIMRNIFKIEKNDADTFRPNFKNERLLIKIFQKNYFANIIFSARKRTRGTYA